MEKLHLPAGYDTVLEEFAKKNNVAFETAFYNLMDFIQLKDYSFHSVKVLVENPDSYLEEGTEIEESEILLSLYGKLRRKYGRCEKFYGYYKRENAFLDARNRV